MSDISEDEELRRAEIALLRSRQMGRDSLEETADKVYAELSTWIKYVDVERWAQLLEWVEAHPQRIRPQDEQFIELDGRLEQLIGFPISHSTTKKVRGPRRGSKQAPESNAKRAETMKRKWEGWKRDGNMPAVGRQPSTPAPEDEAPY